MRAVLGEAIATLRARVGENIDLEVRDFLAVHGKGGAALPALWRAALRDHGQPGADELLPPLPAGLAGPLKRHHQ